ncbi:hypothetical protein DERF_008638 [Dermatophagoides farinae]|uniref:Uncharacterized protein n=1 Tax=Dermatophagoides farinae TaxID=6954 RepID=A0A922L5N9_DERFA|nr:hypothetical protein DERF_008638 [Dermatophagoides farinae]
MIDNDNCDDDDDDDADDDDTIQTIVIDDNNFNHFVVHLILQPPGYTMVKAKESEHVIFYFIFIDSH